MNSFIITSNPVSNECHCTKKNMKFKYRQLKFCKLIRMDTVYFILSMLFYNILFKLVYFIKLNMKFNDFT